MRPQTLYAVRLPLVGTSGGCPLGAHVSLHEPPWAQLASSPKSHRAFFLPGLPYTLGPPGLAPCEAFGLVERLRDTTIFLVEQNVNMALSIAHRGYVLQMGEVVLSGTAQELLQSPLIRQAYLGTVAGE